jgi:hypothetical protein
LLHVYYKIYGEGKDDDSSERNILDYFEDNMIEKFPNIENVHAHINEEDKENHDNSLKTNNINIEKEISKSSNPKTVDGPSVDQATLSTVWPRNDLISTIYLLPMVVGIVLMAGGVFLLSSNFFIPYNFGRVSEVIGVIITYLSIFPGFFIPLSSLSGLSLSALGLFICFIGFDILLLGISIRKNVRFSNLIGFFVFLISALLSLTSLLINGITGAPFALVSLVVNGITSYLLYKRSRIYK